MTKQFPIYNFQFSLNFHWDIVSLIENWDLEIGNCDEFGANVC